MDELLDVLLHPSRWATDAPELRPLTRIYLSLFILGVTFAVAFAAGALTSRWAHKRTGAATSERNERTIARLRRALILLVVFLGAYLAIEMAPWPARLANWLSGVTFVLGALVSARALIHLVALLLTSSVTHVSGQERSRLEREYVPLAEKAMSLAVALIFIIVVAKHFGKDVTSLVAALGVGSLAIGLAAQQTLGNMIAGFVLLVDRPFRPGDRIKLATGEVGEVRDIGVRSTRIELLDGNTLTVPNAELANTRVVTIKI
jgi:MscS family membrane protein